MDKKYYVFFKMNTKYEGKYAIEVAPNISTAQMQVLNKYGVWNYSKITGDEPWALNNIKLHGYTLLDEQKHG